MARGVRGRSSTRWRRAFIFLAIPSIVVMLPATALATGGSSEWPTRGGTSAWPASEPDPVLPDPPPEEAPESALDVTEEEPVLQIAVKGIAFPVAGNAQYSASFGAPRPGGRSHEGVDIFAEKMTPVVAAADGTVSFVRDGIGTDCCVVKIRHDDGRASLYLHLNNDTPETDDGLGYGLAEGIAVGVRVTAGMVIGYVGDSGNAEDTPPHLHFELHNAGGVPVDPYPYLQIAQGAEPALFASALLEQPETLPETGAPFAALALLSPTLIAAGALLAGKSRRLTAAACGRRGESHFVGPPR